VPDVPRFSLFYIGYGLQIIALVLSAIADVSPEVKKRSQKVQKAFEKCHLWCHL